MVDSGQEALLQVAEKLKQQLVDQQVAAKKREKEVASAVTAAIASLKTNRAQVIASCERLEQEHCNLKDRAPQLEEDLERERKKTAELEETLRGLKHQVAALSDKSQLINCELDELQEKESAAAQREAAFWQSEANEKATGDAAKHRCAELQAELQLAQAEATSERHHRERMEKMWQEATNVERSTAGHWDEAEQRLLAEQQRCLQLTEDLKHLQQEGRLELVAERRRNQALLEEQSQGDRALAEERETSKRLLQLRHGREQARQERICRARSAGDSQRLLLLRSFEAWHRQSLLELRAEFDQAKRQELHDAGRQLATQEEKVKAAFGRATAAESEFASEMFTCQKLQQELRELRHKLDSEAIIYRSKAAAQESLLVAERTERQKLEEQLVVVRCKSEETQEACAAREALRCAEVQAHMFAQAEMAESRQQVAHLREELAASRSSEMFALRSPSRWRASGREDSLTHALLHATVGATSVRTVTNGYHGADSITSSWEVRQCKHGDQFTTLLQSSSIAVGSLLKQVRRLDDAHRTLAGEGGHMRATPAQLRAVRALEKQTTMLERTNKEWTSSLVETNGSLEDFAGAGHDRRRENGHRSPDADDEVPASPAARGAVMVSVLRRTETRLERLHERLQRLLPSEAPEASAVDAPMSQSTGW